MSRKVYRVPLDFNWPRGEVWSGYVRPDELDEISCETCEGTGYSPFARNLHSRWYGYVPFDPAETGSTPFLPTSPVIHARAKHNVESAVWYYGRGALAIAKEAVRLAAHFNNGWLHHLDQDDVDALIAEGRLMDFTHTWSKETRWQPIEPPPVVTAEQVNLWSVQSMGHDSINCHVVIEAACIRADEPVLCAVCDGHSSFEAYPGQRAETEAWKRTDPPVGDCYQLWETVSDGSPVSPVFVEPKMLATWIKNHGSSDDGRDTNFNALVHWVEKDGSSIGSLVSGPNIGVISGVQAAAERGMSMEMEES